MLPLNKQAHSLRANSMFYRVCVYFLWLGLLLLAPFGLVYAADSSSDVVPGYLNTTTNLSAVDMITNLVSQLPNIMSLITAIAYVTGMYFVFHGVMLLKQYGEMRTQMSGQHHLKGPVIFIIVGAMMLYLPSSVQVGLSTFWTEPNPYGYLQDQDQWAQFFKNIFMVVQLFGVIAFIRGLILLTHLGGHGGQQGTFGKGMTHIIGGILCINIYQFVQVVMVTFGLQSLISG
jgi:intracellular multiplication protein IcmC